MQNRISLENIHGQKTCSSMFLDIVNPVFSTKPVRMKRRPRTAWLASFLVCKCIIWQYTSIGLYFICVFFRKTFSTNEWYVLNFVYNEPPPAPSPRPPSPLPSSVLERSAASAKYWDIYKCVTFCIWLSSHIFSSTHYNNLLWYLFSYFYLNLEHSRKRCDFKIEIAFTY